MQSIKNLVNKNYTHNSLMKEVVKKQSLKSINKVINLKTGDGSIKTFRFEDKEELEKTVLDLKPDSLINSLSEYEGDEFLDSLVLINVDNAIKKMIDENPTWGKQKLIEKLVQENPLHKDRIFSILSQTFEEQVEIIKNRLSGKDQERFMRGLQKEDIKELQSLSENRSVDQIKALRSVNRSHSNLLAEIKSKPSLSSIKADQLEELKIKPSSSGIKSEADKPSFGTSQLDDTMNLFELFLTLL